MINLSNCGYCIHCKGFDKGYGICDAFPGGIPYEHMDKDLKSLKECNNGIGFEPKENTDKPSE